VTTAPVPVDDAILHSPGSITQYQREVIARLRYLYVTDVMGPTPKDCSFADAEAAIAWMLRQPRRPEYVIARWEDLTVGVYTDGPRIWRIRKSRQTRYGILYAEEIKVVYDTNGERTLRRSYMGGVRYHWPVLQNAMRLTIDQAEALSLSIGACIVCGRKLTDPNSVRKSIGPVCIKRLTAAFEVVGQGDVQVIYSQGKIGTQTYGVIRRVKR
jgi:hypothetical protein